MAKKIRVKTVVYDRKTQEWVQKNITMPVSEEFVEAFMKDFGEHFATDREVRGHGAGKDYNKKIPGMETPLADQNRFYMDVQFHIIEDNEDETVVTGWEGF